MPHTKNKNHQLPNKTYLLLNIRMISSNKGFNVPTYIYLFMLGNKRYLEITCFRYVLLIFSILVIIYSFMMTIYYVSITLFD